jgi:hypothetical protein
LRLFLDLRAWLRVACEVLCEGGASIYKDEIKKVHYALLGRDRSFGQKGKTLGMHYTFCRGLGPLNRGILFVG